MIHKMEEIVKLLFQRTSVERILASGNIEQIFYDNVDASYIQDLVLTYDQKFSDTEVNLQIQEVNTQIDYERQRHSYQMDSGKLNVFSILFYYVSEILTFYENQCVCRYNQILQWNELTKSLGQDLPVTAFMAAFDAKCGQQRKNFSWPAIIGHNNGQLNKILNKGMADNHFHLRCSSPYFEVSWINLMNYPARSEYVLSLKTIDKNYRDKGKKAELGFEKLSLRSLTLAAALIRLYLCSKLQHFNINLCEFEQLEAVWSDKKEILKSVESLLCNPFRLENKIYRLQSEIDCLKVGYIVDDYMQIYANNQCFESEKEYQLLAGERWFLYQMLKRVFLQDCGLNKKEYNLFYAYLRIKSELRSELVQVNQLIGFENFQIYQSRKDYFSHTFQWQHSEDKLARLAVRSVLNNPAMKYLEVRISPTDSAEQNAILIRNYDQAIIGDKNFDGITRNGCEESEDISAINPFVRDDLRKKFYYIFHFPKVQDNGKYHDNFLECRHYYYRKKIQSRAAQIMKFREMYPQYARRVVGIDACSQEIGCRPEVFARVFRVLRHHTILPSEVQRNYELPQLKITYHVGEEFLDIADGLRAIDEAVRFLKLDCGDRLGHATALGIDVKKWYQSKNGSITMPLQDYLDNIVWLHHTLIKYNIKDMSSLKGWLEEKFSQYFAYIYQPYIWALQNQRWELQRDKDRSGKDVTFQGKADINTYYLAWLLRGDKPSLYKSGDYKEDDNVNEDWERFAITKSTLRSDDIRNMHEVSLLYYTYHYNKEVREKGSQIKTFHLPDFYIDGVIAVQKEMQKEIIKRGISIETNPSSNILLSTLENYSEHPLKVFYNCGLTYNEEELMNCPQLNVSINTDDSGVFATRVENEYALMACAMEQCITPDGKQKNHKEFIYTWLDNIREMGLRQGFAKIQNLSQELP